MMDCQNIETLLIDYIDGILDADQRQEVEDHLVNCKTCRKAFDLTKQLLTEMQHVKDETPSSQIKDDFYTMLEQEKKIQDTSANKVIVLNKKVLLRTLRYAAEIIILVGLGIVMGKNVDMKRSTSEEMAELRTEIQQIKQDHSLVSLSQPTASQRLKAIDAIEEQLQPDEKVIEALIHTMNHDDNPNVRLAAASALSRYPENMQVRDAIIDALGVQNDPIIQITLIHIIIQMQDERAKNVLKSIIANEESIPTVKQQAEQGLEVFI